MPDNTQTSRGPATNDDASNQKKPFPGPSETRPYLLPKLALKPWVSPTPAGIVLTNARVVDPAAGKLLDGLQTMVIRDGRVAAVYPVDNRKLVAEEETSLRRVDLGGRYVSPGLIDGHVHVTAIPGTRNVKEMAETPVEVISYRTTYVLREMLMRGFTSVRDTGGANKHLADAIEEGLLPGPRLFQCGKAISQTGGHGDFTAPKSGGEPGCCGGHSILLARTADGVPQVLKATREEIKAGAE
ncbi:hypothetical protein JCM3774_005849 [Rhodotorula dairenensis]